MAAVSPNDRSKFDAKDWIIYDLMIQNCSIRDRESYELDSGFIRAHAEAMDYLHKIGMIELIGGEDQGAGRGRLGKIKKGMGYV